MIAGPAFSAGRYGLACGNVTLRARERLGVTVVTGMHIDNAATAIDVQAGNAAATFDSSVINAATTPFKVEGLGKLSMTRSNVVGSKGASSVAGTFTASHLDYDSNGSEGIAMVDPSAVFSAASVSTPSAYARTSLRSPASPKVATRCSTRSDA